MTNPAKKSIRGAITILNLFTVAGIVASSVAGSILWVSSKVENAILPVDKKAQAAIAASTQTANTQKNMNGALKFLVEKNGGEYDPETGVVIIKLNGKRIPYDAISSTTAGLDF